MAWNNGISYKERLKLPDWAELRRRGLDRAGNKCERCGRTECEFHLHHLNYDRFNRELLEDLLVVCVPCHKILDRGRRVQDAFRRAARDIFGLEWANDPK